VPDARVYHRGKQTRPRDRGWHLRREFVNSALCQVKNLPLKYFLRNFSRISSSHLKSVLGLYREGGMKVLLGSERELACRVPIALKHRISLHRRSGSRFQDLEKYLPAP
jgi:hypothetical protein